ncbi:MAG: ABC transporter ATP-binding protein [Deltaproteobacteria bacterium]|nr:ABC transporter ATP-binding protein [Deltaproteobacteria bacterium]
MPSETGATSIALTEVRRVYDAGARRVEALRGVTLTLRAGTATAIVGPSGSGKSTLLHICGALDRPTAGEVVVLGTNLTTASDATLTRFRRDHLGFIFQFFHLLPTLSALENVMLPARLARRGARAAETLATTLLARVGLADRVQHRPAQLSGGERQRVAIARALVLDPAIILADEPTGNLDRATGGQVLSLLFALAHERQRTVFIVTHDPEVARLCDRTVTLRDGQVAL